MATKKAAEGTEQKAPVTYSKEQILTFKKFSTRRDLLTVKLNENQRDFMTPKGKKGKVNN